MNRLFGRVRKKVDASASRQAGAGVSLPPIQGMSVRLSAISLVTRSPHSVPVQLSPGVEHDRKSNLIDVNGNTVIVWVRDVVRALPVFEIVAEWQMQLLFSGTVDKTEIVAAGNWQWITQHIDPYTAD